MEAVAADDVVAVDPVLLAVHAVGEKRLVGGDVVRRHVLGIVNDDPAHPVARLVEVLGQLGLAVNDNRGSGQTLQVDAMAAPFVGDVETLVDFALGVHPVGDLRLAHQVGEAVFQNAGAHPGEHVFTAVPLEHDRLDALKMQKLRQHQSRRTAPDNPYLRAHFRAPEFRSITVLYLRSFL